MTDYEDFKKLRTWHPMLDYISRKPSDLRLLIVSPDEAKRLQACGFFKELLEEKLEEEKSQGKVLEYEVTIVDISNKNLIDFMYTATFERSGIHDGRLFILIYHNADKHRDLPQIIFDQNKPGILSYTPEGYDKIVNYSKKNCYRRIDV